MARKVRAGRMWTITYEVNPLHAPSGGYRRSGFGIAVLLCLHLENSEERKEGARCSRY